MPTLRSRSVGLVLWLMGCATGQAAPPRAAVPLVEVTQVVPRVVVDLRYATAQNFTGQVLYPPSARCYLRADVAEALAKAATALAQEGLFLKLWDCYRPKRVQFQLWDIVHDERYVANPRKGSRHNRGAAVDLTLCDAQGQELPMPTPFDDFGEKAHRDYQKLPKEVIQNRAKLEQAMVQAGFSGMPTEWWHFDFGRWQGYPLDDISFDVLAERQAKPQTAPAQKPSGGRGP